MTPDDFRKLALALPGAAEGEHMQHPDFRVGGKIFASLLPAPRAPEARAMVKLTPEQQATLLRAEPDVFVPAAGAWGRGGATLVHLRAAKKPTVRKALTDAWRSVAPTSLAPDDE